MSGNPSAASGDDDLPIEIPVAFAFKVEFMPMSGSGALQCSFQEVSGLERSIETEDLPEGGENSFVHQLPVGPKARRLLLRRGLVERDSWLVDWLRQSLEWGLDVPLKLMNVKVQLLDQQLRPLIYWTCNGAYPVRWALDSLESTKNQAAIEEIELAYRTCETRS